jgi:hypothetical protein
LGDTLAGLAHQPQRELLAQRRAVFAVQLDESRAGHGVSMGNQHALPEREFHV